MSWERAIAASVAAGGPVEVRAVAAACGVTPRTVRRRAAREGWEHPFPDVVAVPGTRMDGRAWARAAVLHAAGSTGDAVRDLAAVTRGTALALLGLARAFPTQAEVAIPACRVLAPRARLTIVRSRRLTPADVAERDGVAVVTGPALLRDLAAVRTRTALRAATIDLAKAGVVDPDELPTYLADQPPFPGKPVLRQVTADLTGVGRTDSPFELEVRQRLSADGIPLDRGQVPVPTSAGIHLDLGILAVRFGIEVDSLAHHASREDLRRDAARANAIAALDDDWRVLHATWVVLEEGWTAFVDQVRAVIAAQSRRHLGVPWPRPLDVRT